MRDHMDHQRRIRGHHGAPVAGVVGGPAPRIASRPTTAALESE